MSLVNDYNGTADGSDVYPVGTSVITWTVTDIYNHTSSCEQSITVTDDELPLLDCVADQVRCSNIVADNSYQVDGAEFDFSNEWDNCGVASVINDQNGASSLAGHVFVTGTTLVTWTVQDVNGNSYSCSFNVTINPLPVASIDVSSADEWCNGVTLTAQSSTSDNLWFWSNGETTQSIDLTIATAPAGTYSVIATDLNGCTSDAAAEYYFDPQSLSSSYTIIGFEEVHLKQKNYVQSGSVGLTGVGKEIKIEKYSAVNGPGSFVMGDNLNIHNQAIVTTAISDPAVVTLPTMHYNTEPAYSGTITVSQYSTITVNDNNIGLKIKKYSDVTITGNAFGKIEIDKGCTVTFTSADIDINELKVKNASSSTPTIIKFTQDAKVRVFKEVNIQKYVIVNPDNFNVVFYVGEDPNPTTPGQTISGNFVYAFRGDDEKDFWRYDPAVDAWISLQDAPDEVKVGGALVYGGNNYIYAFRGDDNNDFWRYDILANSWSVMTDAPQGVKDGAGLVYTGGNSIYALRGDDKKDFWKYDIPSDSWSSLANAPQKVKEGGSLTYTGGNYIYAFRGDDQDDFWRYDISSNSWSSMEDAPNKVKVGGALAYAGGDYIYGFRGDDEDDFWRYKISTDSWTSMEDAPDDVKDGASLVYDGGNSIYAVRGNDEDDFWRYDIPTDEWTSKENAPDDVEEGGASTYAPGVAVPPNNSGGGNSLEEGKFDVYPKGTTINASAYVPNGEIKVHGSASSSEPGHMNGLFIANEVRAEAKYTYWNWNSCIAVPTLSAAIGPMGDELEERIIQSLKVITYPNPFSDKLAIEFEATQSGRYVVELINITGQQIQLIQDSHVEEGEIQRHVFDGKSLAEGIYIVRVASAHVVVTSKVIHTK